MYAFLSKYGQTRAKPAKLPSFGLGKNITSTHPKTKNYCEI